MQQVRVAQVQDAQRFITRLLLLKQVDALYCYLDYLNTPADGNGLSVDPKQYTYVIARDEPLTTLLHPNFVNMNNATYEHLGVVALHARIDSGNSMCIAPAADKIQLTLDRETYHSLGLVHLRKQSKFHRQKSIEQGDFFAVEIPLRVHPEQKSGPYLESSAGVHNYNRAKKALDASRVGTATLALTCGKRPVFLPEASSATVYSIQAKKNHVRLLDIPDLRTLVITETPSKSDSQLYPRLINWIAALLSPLPNCPVCPPTLDIPTTKTTGIIEIESYTGFCNSDLAADVLKKAQDVVDRGVVPFAIVVAHAYADAPVIFAETPHRASATPGFGGDAAIGVLLTRGRSLGFEVRARQDL